jgi:hypothetical protein
MLHAPSDISGAGQLLLRTYSALNGTNLVCAQQVHRYDWLWTLAGFLKGRRRLLVYVVTSAILVRLVARAARRGDEAALWFGPCVRRGCDDGREDEGDECELHDE